MRTKGRRDEQEKRSLIVQQTCPSQATTFDEAGRRPD